MSFHLLEGTPIASTSPLIKAGEVANFTDAALLLRAAKRIAADTEAADAEARRAGYEKGFAQGLSDAKQVIASEAAKFAEAVGTIRADYAAQVAEAAHAATTTIIGELDDAELISRIVALQLSRQDENASVQLILSPIVEAEVRERLGGMSNLAIVADPALAPTDCHIVNGQGRTIASLSLQLRMLGERWGLDTETAKTGAAE